MSGFLTKLAHNNRIPLGLNSDLKTVAEVIRTEKQLVEGVQGLASTRSKASLSLKEWGVAEGPDLGDVLTKLSMLFEYVSSAERQQAEHLATFRLHFKAIRTKEEELATLKRNQTSLASRIEAQDRKVSKMKEENKDLPAASQKLSEMRQEMVGLENTVLNDETKLGDFKRSSTREAMSLKLGALLELGEKTVIIAELGKLLVAEIPTARTEIGYQRAPYNGYETTDNIMSEAQRCLQDVVFSPAAVKFDQGVNDSPRPDGRFDHARQESYPTDRYYDASTSQSGPVPPPRRSNDDYDLPSRIEPVQHLPPIDLSAVRGPRGSSDEPQPHIYNTQRMNPAHERSSLAYAMDVPTEASHDDLEPPHFSEALTPVQEGSGRLGHAREEADIEDGDYYGSYVEHEDVPISPTAHHLPSIAVLPAAASQPASYARTNEALQHEEPAYSYSRPTSGSGRPPVESSYQSPPPAKYEAPRQEEVTRAAPETAYPDYQRRSDEHARQSFGNAPPPPVQQAYIPPAAPKYPEERPYVPRPDDGAYHGPSHSDPPPPRAADVPTPIYAELSTATSHDVVPTPTLPEPTPSFKPLMIRGESALGSKYGDIHVAGRSDTITNSNVSGGPFLGVGSSGYNSRNASGDGSSIASGERKLNAAAFQRRPVPQSQYTLPPTSSSGHAPSYPSPSDAIRDSYRERDVVPSSPLEVGDGDSSVPRFDVSPLHVQKREEKPAPARAGTMPTTSYGGGNNDVPPYVAPTTPSSGFQSSRFVTKLD